MLTELSFFIIELFAITNAVSGDLLQGSLEPQEVTHQVHSFIHSCTILSV